MGYLIWEIGRFLVLLLLLLLCAVVLLVSLGYLSVGCDVTDQLPHLGDPAVSCSAPPPPPL